MSCVFCALSSRIIVENELAVATWDAFPVTSGHALVVPRRHVPDFFACTVEEQAACNELLHFMREVILAQDESVQGFNVGVNIGKAAGQTIFHCHIHLIPRRFGDVENPRGGVRNAIPGKGEY